MKSWLLHSVIISLVLQSILCYVPNAISQTRGKVWPQPNNMQQTSEVLEVSGKVAWKIAQIGYWAWQGEISFLLIFHITYMSKFTI